MVRRVLISGLGVVSPIGNDIASYWQALLTKDNEARNIPFLREEYMRNRRGYYVNDWMPTFTSVPYLEGGRSCQFAVSAAEMALGDAGLLDRVSELSCGVSLANGLGDAEPIERARAGGPASSALEHFMFRLDAAVASRFSLSGPSFTVSTACSAGLYSIEIGARAIQRGWADVMIVGGSEGFSRVAQACFNRLGALDSKNCRPFDVNREGTLFGEGAAVMVLESELHAQNRGWTRSYAYLAGCGDSCDGYHATAPDPSADYTCAAARRAIDEAELSPEAIDCVIAHGTGTALNDVAESVTLERVFGDRIQEIPVCAIKSKIGHSGGAAGAFSCLTAVLALERGAVPPTAHLNSLDPRCRLKIVTGTAKQARLDYALVNSYGFGGNNISLVIGRYATDANR